MLEGDSKQRVKDLCDQIAREQDRDRFSQLISELNQLLEEAGTRKNGKPQFLPSAETPS